MRWLVLGLMLGGGLAAGQAVALPTLFNVAGVAAGDALNIRAAPDAGAAIVGRLAPDATAVEVVARDPSGRWGQVNVAGEGGSGWVALRYLAEQEDVWAAGQIPPTLRCFGTEPFWSLGFPGGEAVLGRPGEPEVAAAVGAVLGTGIPGDPRRAVVARADGLRLTAAVTPQACSDGMSDSAYGLSTLVVWEQGGATNLLTGCCTLGR